MTATGWMDNPYYDWSPIDRRPPLSWPGGARLAVAVIVSLEHVNWYPPEGSHVGPSVGFYSPFPAIVDIHAISPVEYGNRVGVFRVVELLQRHGIPPTIAMDASTAERCPQLVAWLQERDAEFLGHGLSLDQMVTEDMPEDTERAYIARSLDAVEAATGTRPRGWLGIDYGESTRTVELLARAGLDYVCDWPTDEQPHPLKTSQGRIDNLPVVSECDDVVACTARRLSPVRYGRILVEQFERMYADSEQQGRAMVLNLHPWVIGQPYRVRHLAAALEQIGGREGVWYARGGEIIDAYRAATQG